MTKRDLFLLGVGTCFGILMCSVAAFLLVLSDGANTPTPTSVLSFTKTFTPTLTSTQIPAPTITITAFPLVLESPTITPTTTITNIPTNTFTPTQTPDKRSLYSQIPNRELYTYADDHKNEWVMVRGMIFNINNTEELQIFAGGSSDYPMYLVFQAPFSGIYENDFITVYAVVRGTNCGTNAFGGEICQPLLAVDFWEKK